MENETDRLEVTLKELINNNPHWDLSLKQFKTEAKSIFLKQVEAMKQNLITRMVFI